MDLREWTMIYVKHKDVLTRKLVDVAQRENSITFTYADHVMHAYALERLEVPKKVDGKTLVTTLHTKENVDFLVKHWKEFSAHEGLTLIFANPEKNEKWLIHPHTHSQVSDGDIEPGIRTLAESVGYV